MAAIAVKALTGETITMTMKATDTTEMVKTKLIDSGVPVETLNFAGKELENDCVLSEVTPVFEIGGFGEGSGSGGGDEDGDEEDDVAPSPRVLFGHKMEPRPPCDDCPGTEDKGIPAYFPRRG